MAKEAQLKALENQINPHFLYNTLESVNWRAKAIGESEISAMVESLGSLLRETIRVKEKVVSLKHELEIVSAYITIQKIRYGDRLEYMENVSENLMNLQLPHLTIQPLVENAIYYALEEVIGPCRIEVSAKKSDHLFIVSVRNNGSQFEEYALEKIASGQTSTHGFGVGILNIEKRIQMIYGTEYGLELCNEDEDTAVVNIYLPGGTEDEIIVVDDERIIRETIASLVDWESLGITLIGTAENGIEAYNIILDEYPEIVLTDIKMPGLGGLDLYSGSMRLILIRNSLFYLGMENLSLHAVL